MHLLRLRARLGRPILRTVATAVSATVLATLLPAQNVGFGASPATAATNEPAQLGLEPFWNFHAADLGAGWGLSINTFTGNLVLDKAALTIPGRGPDLAETLVYNSQSGAERGLGPGWALGSDSTLTENADGSVTLRDGDATAHTFVRKADGTYVAPAGVYLTVAKVATGVFTIVDKARDSSRFESGQLVSVTDEKGNKLAFTRDAAGRTTEAKDASGRALAYTRDANGRLTKITDPAGRPVSFAYDGSGRLASVTDPLANTTAFAYDASGRLTSFTDAKGGVTSVAYDDSGRVAKIADARSTPTTEYATTFAYDPSTSTTTITDAAGNRSSVTHNSAGNPVEVTDGAGNVVKKTWSANNLVTDADAKGNLSFTYDAAGNVTKAEETTSSTTSSVETAVYDAKDNPTVLTDANGNRTELKYDSASNLSSAIVPTLKEADANIYDSYGNLTSSTDPGSATYNLIDNGSFEATASTGVPTSWYYSGTTSALSVDRNVAWYGTASLKIASSSTIASAGAYTDSVAVTPGQKLTLSAEARFDQLTGTGTNYGAAIGVEFYDAAGSFLGASYTNYRRGTGNDALIVTATAPATVATAQVEVRADNFSGSVWFDGVQLESPLAATEGHTRSRFDYVDNSSFEAGGRHWYAGGTSGAVSVVSDAAFGGVKSLKVAQATVGTAHGYSDARPVRPAEALTLSALVKTADVAGTTGAYTFVAYYDAAGTYIPGSIAWTNIVTGTHDWARYAVATTAPATAAKARVFVILDGASGTLWADNVKLVPRATTRYGYDAGGNHLTSTTDALGNATSATYDAVGNRTSATDASGKTTRFASDANNRLVSVTDAAGGTTRFAYDPLGFGVKVRDARSASETDDTYATSFGYDPLNKRSTLTDPLGRTSAYGYDRAANLTEVANPSGTKVSFTYDPANRPVTKALAGGASYTFGHDGADNLTSVTDGSNLRYSFAYDAANRLSASTDLWGYQLTLGRDPAGNVTSASDSEQKQVGYQYGADQRLLQVTDTAGRATAYRYDDAGRLFQVVRGDGRTATLTYDAAGRLATLADPGNPAGRVLVYGYDQNGRVTRVDDASGRQSFAYDALGRLTSWTNSAGTTTSYAYDAAGNLTTKGAKSFTHDAASQITNPGFAYDANGNLTSDGTYSYTWDAEHRLTKVTKAADGALVAEYAYDYGGLRVKKTTPSGTTRYHWDAQSRLVRESDQNGATLARYVWDDDDDLVAIEKAGAMYYPHVNDRGDILAVTDVQGNRVATYDYGPWGELVSQTGTFNQPWRYAGYYLDDETGLYYLQARYYSPGLGRFLAKEPLYGDFCSSCGFAALVNAAAAVSPYAYVLNDPVGLVDPDGRHPKQKGKQGKQGKDLSSREKAELEKKRLGKRHDRNIVNQAERKLVYNEKVVERERNKRKRRQSQFARAGGAAAAAGAAIWWGAKALSPACGPFAPACFIVL